MCSRWWFRRCGGWADCAALARDEFTDGQRFAFHASPLAWAHAATELADATAALFDCGADSLEAIATPGRPALTKSAFSRSALLLAALALENILKAHLVTVDPAGVADARLNEQLRTHDLLELSSRLSYLQLTERERDLVGIATEALPYWARYPIPLRASQLAHEREFGKAEALVFWRLFWRLHSSLHERIRDGWDSGVGLVERLTEYSRAPHPWDAGEA